MTRKTIRELREGKGWTQAEFAFHLRVTPSSVYSWEAGKYEPKASQVRAIAKLCGVSMDAIAFEVEDAKNVA
jgi:transcriptional regulator with XRE-family HTH domain